MILVDPEFEYLLPDSFVGSNGYAIVKPELKLLHRIVIGAKSGEQVDHINRNRLDCRRENLRIVTRSENQLNRNKGKNNTSGYKNVRWDKSRSKWLVDYIKDGKTQHIGRFETLKEAVKARDFHLSYQ